MKRQLYLIVLLFILINRAYAQGPLSGTVTDSLTNEPLAGAIVTDVSNNNHSAVDNSGRYMLAASSKGDTILITYTGYNPQRLVANGQVMHIKLNVSAAAIKEVIVSANRDKQVNRSAPETINIISKTAMEETKATQLDQLLNRSAGVYMVDLGNQQHAMAIRQPLGYNNYFLYMEDGIPIRVEGDFNHNALIEINDAALARIEIIKGPASSLYGSEAVGAAVNFITQAPSLYPTAKIEAELGSYGYKRANFFASTTVKKLGLYIGGYYADRNTSADQYDNFHKLALNFRAGYTFSSNTRLTVTAAKINYYTDQKGGLDSAQFFNKNYVNDPISNQRFTYRKVDAFRARATLEHSWNSNSATGFTVYYRNNSEGQNPFYDESTPVNMHSTGQINVDAFSSYGAIIQHIQKFERLKAQWITGITADISPETYNAQFISINLTPQGVYDNYTATDSMLTRYAATLYNTAIYTQLEITPVNRLKVTAGLRYDRLDYHFTNSLAPGSTTGPADTVNHFAHLTPKAGLNYDLGKNKGLYASYSLGFAPPNITDLYTGYSVPDLKPSTFYNYEAGFWIGLANRGYAELAVYQMNGVNEIVPVIQPNGISLEENTGKTRHRGVELNVNYNIMPDVLLRVGGTYARHEYISFTDGTTSVGNKLMADAPPYIINAQATYKPHYLRHFLISLEWQSLGRYYTDPENMHQYSGFNIFNVRAAYNVKNFEVWANCLNVADKVYATIVTYGYGKNTYYPGMLRTFNVGIGYSFIRKNQ